MGNAAAKAEPVVTTLYISCRAQNEIQELTISANLASTTERESKDINQIRLAVHALCHLGVLESSSLRSGARNFDVKLVVSIWVGAYRST